MEKEKFFTPKIEKETEEKKYPEGIPEELKTPLYLETLKAQKESGEKLKREILEVPEIDFPEKEINREQFSEIALEKEEKMIDKVAKKLGESSVEKKQKFFRKLAPGLMALSLFAALSFVQPKKTEAGLFGAIKSAVAGIEARRQQAVREWETDYNRRYGRIKMINLDELERLPEEIRERTQVILNNSKRYLRCAVVSEDEKTLFGRPKTREEKVIAPGGILIWVFPELGRYKEVVFAYSKEKVRAYRDKNGIPRCEFLGAPMDWREFRVYLNGSLEKEKGLIAGDIREFNRFRYRHRKAPKIGIEVHIDTKP